MTNSTDSAWTLERELCTLTSTADVGSALKQLGLLPDADSSFRLHEQSKEWDRGGAETYIFRFRVEAKDARPIDALIKACVAFAPATTLQAILQGWIERRELLAANGVGTPALYYWGKGVVVEEFVPFEVKALLERKQSLPKILNGLSLYAAALSRLGFAPVEPFRDLRSHGEDVVVVDFGEDLGPAGITTGGGPRLFDALCRHLKLTGLNLPARRVDELRAMFAAASGEFLH